MHRSAALILAGAILAVPAGAGAYEGRYVGSYHHTSGIAGADVMRHYYDLSTRAVLPGSADLRLRMSLSYRANPGQENSDLLSSRFFADLRKPAWRLTTQFTPWQQASVGVSTSRDRNLLFGLDVSPRGAPRMALKYERQDRETLQGRSTTDDRRAEVSYAAGGIFGSNLSWRRLDARPMGGLNPDTRTEEWRGGLRTGVNLGRANAQATYDALYSTYGSRDRDRTFYTQRMNLNSSWAPSRRLTVGTSALVYWGRSEDNALTADQSINERYLSGRVAYQPVKGLSFEGLREYRRRQAVDGDIEADYARLQAILRRDIVRGMTFQSGYLRSFNIRSEDGSIPQNTVFTLVDGRLRKGINARAELRASRAGGSVSTGTQWHRLVQLRTLPSRDTRFEVTWRRDTLPEIDGKAQTDRQWEYQVGYQPATGADLVATYRRQDGRGRIDREERYGSLTGNLRLGQRSSLSLDWSRREALVLTSRSSEIIKGTDYTFWPARRTRVQLSWRQVAVRGRATLDTYGLSVDRNF
jgi:hypothetical protein